jgi:hypothetical protein
MPNHPGEKKRTAEQAIYDILKQRAIVPNLTYPEYEQAAQQVVARIAPEEITPVDDLLNRLELTIFFMQRNKPLSPANPLDDSIRVLF